MFDDPYDKKSPLGMGDHFIMLIFFLVVVCVGFLMVKAFILDKFINEQTQQQPTEPAKAPS
jgi:hypothetical protein